MIAYKKELGRPKDIRDIEVTHRYLQ
jgi:hypothetical protein